MALTIVHNKVDTTADYTQADVDALIASGFYPPGTLLASLVLPSHWNDSHAISGTLAASSVDVTASTYQIDTNAQTALDNIGKNLHQYTAVNMLGGDYALTNEEAKASVLVALNSGVSSILTVPTTSDGYVCANLMIITGFAGNVFSLRSESGGSAFPLTAPIVDLIAYQPGSTPASFYYYNIKNNAFDSSWLSSLYAPTQGAVYDALIGALTPSSLSIGTVDPMTVHGSLITSQLAINSDTTAIEEMHTHSDTVGNGATYYGARSRGTTASPTIVQSGDYARIDSAVAYDGTDYEVLGYTAWIVDGTPGNNDMPGSWNLYVTPDGGFTAALALKIGQDKKAAFQDGITATSLMLNGATALNASNFFGIKENTNTYAETNIQNINAGTSASSDYVATADNGNDTTNYIDLGINSSAYSDSSYTITSTNDGYLYVNGGNLALGTQTVAKSIKFHTGGTLSANNRGGISGTGEWNNNGIPQNTHTPEGAITILANMFMLVPRYLEIASGFIADIGANATMEII
jgi:hypothetical protein